MYLRIEQEDLPTIRLVKPGEEILKYKFPVDLETMTSQDVLDYIKDFEEDKLTPFVLSEPIPQTSLLNGAEKIVGLDLDTYFDGYRDLLVYVKTPFDKGGDRLRKVWDELVGSLVGIEGLVFGEFDLSLNEHAKIPLTDSYVFILFTKFGD